jgi:hypothetical protein
MANPYPNSIYYLASAYTNRPSHEEAFQEACLATARLLSNNIPVISPIVYGHAIVSHADINLPRNSNFWSPVNFKILSACTGVIVLETEGTSESVGVQAEVAYAKVKRMPVYRLAPGKEYDLAQMLKGV